MYMTKNATAERFRILFCARLLGENLPDSVKKFAPGLDKFLLECPQVGEILVRLRDVIGNLWDPLYEDLYKECGEDLVKSGLYDFLDQVLYRVTERGAAIPAFLKFMYEIHGSKAALLLSEDSTLSVRDAEALAILI